MNNPKQSDHPFIGTWIDDDENTNAIFQIDLIDDEFFVTGNCISDGEKFKITNTSFDGSSLKFDARMPSTDWKTKNELTLRDDGKVDLQLTTYEIWKKKLPTRSSTLRGITSDFEGNIYAPESEP